MTLQTGALTDTNIVAVTLWAEARGESIEGRVAVVCVIRNRMRKRSQTAREVCLAKWQFSCWNEGTDKNHQALSLLVDALARGETIADPLFLECQWIAKGVLSGVVRDITKSADHYLTTSLLSSKERPSWVLAMAHTVTLGAHTFYRS